MLGYLSVPSKQPVVRSSGVWSGTMKFTRRKSSSRNHYWYRNFQKLERCRIASCPEIDFNIPTYETVSNNQQGYASPGMDNSSQNPDGGQQVLARHSDGYEG